MKNNVYLVNNCMDSPVNLLSKKLKIQNTGSLHFLPGETEKVQIKLARLKLDD